MSPGSRVPYRRIPTIQLVLLYVEENTVVVDDACTINDIRITLATFCKLSALDQVFTLLFNCLFQKLSEKSQTEAVDSLLKSIYDSDVLTEQIRARSVTEHIEVATAKDKVVEISIMLNLFQLYLCENIRKSKIKKNKIK